MRMFLLGVVTVLFVVPVLLLAGYGAYAYFDESGLRAREHDACRARMKNARVTDCADEINEVRFEMVAEEMARERDGGL